MMNVNDDHLVEGVDFVPTPNCNQRPKDTKIDLIVIHNISLPPGLFGNNFIEDFFCNRLDKQAHPYFSTIAELTVSSHVVIYRDGKIKQFVPFHLRAWHAGRSSFQGKDECNDYSIGIELEGSDAIAYTSAQYRALCELTRALMDSYQAITPDRIVGHSDIAPGRKTDPGPYFEWDTYRQLLKEAT